MKAGCYILDLYCDGDQPPPYTAPGHDSEPARFTGPTETECVRLARQAGWVVGKERCVCPLCHAAKEARPDVSRETSPQVLVPQVMVRRCTKCLREMPATTEHFRPLKSAPGGLRQWCRDCFRVYDADYARRNREHLSAMRRERRRANPEKTRAEAAARRDYFRAYGRAWYLLTKELVPVPEAARMVGLAPATVYEAVRAGRLRRYVRNGRVHVHRLEVSDYPARRAAGHGSRALSLDAPLTASGSLNLYQRAPDGAAVDPVQAVLEGEGARFLWDWVETALSARQQEVLTAFLDGDLSAEAAGRRLGTRPAEVRRALDGIQAKARQCFGTVPRPWETYAG